MAKSQNKTLPAGDSVVHCILNIDMTCRSLYLSKHELAGLNLLPNSVVYGDVIRYSYIQICSVLDELKILNSFAKDNLYLRDTLYVLSPAIKSINKFSGIRKARNVMLAHFNRDEKGQFTPWWKSLMDFKLPRTRIEINQIYGLLHMINGFIVTRFYSELEQLSAVYRPEVMAYEQWARQEEKNAEGANIFEQTLFSEINSRLNEKQIADKIIIDLDLKDFIKFRL